jgi:hypothetical protein
MPAAQFAWREEPRRVRGSSIDFIAGYALRCVEA